MPSRSYRICFAAAALLALAAFPAVAQSVTQPPPDIGTLIAQAFGAFADFRTGAILAGIVIATNLLTNLVKIPALSGLVPAPYRPALALFIGLTGSIFGARAAGSSWQAALTIGIPAGIAAGGGAIALHETVQLVKSFFAKPTAVVKGAIAAAFLVGLLLPQTSCAFFQKEATHLESCGTQAAQAILNLFGGASPTPISVIESFGPAASCVAQAVVDYENTQQTPGVAAPPAPAAALASNGGLGGDKPAAMEVMIGGTKTPALEQTIAWRARCYQSAKAYLAIHPVVATK